MDAGVDVEVHITGPALYTDHAGGEGGLRTRTDPRRGASDPHHILAPDLSTSPGGSRGFELVQARTGYISGSLVSMTTHLRVTIFGHSWSLMVLENVAFPNPTPGSLYILGHPPLGGISGLNSISYWWNTGGGCGGHCQRPGPAPHDVTAVPPNGFVGVFEIPRARRSIRAWGRD